MKELNLSEIRGIQLELLIELDKFCKENNIKYFLCNGTLLGAVKYKGYIPWDDDIDVCLLREDYERLISIYNQQNTNSKYKLFSFQTEKNYFFPFAKLSDQTTVLVESNIDNGVQFGLNIDIFPIDNYGNNKFEIKRNFRKFKSLRQMLNLSKLKNFTSATKTKYYIKKIVSYPFRVRGAKYFTEKINNLGLSSTASKKFIGNCVWGFYGVGEAHEKCVFKETILKEFEGKEFPVPIGYDSYLRGLYGDYHKDPPISEQCTHHSFKAYSK